MLRNTFLIIVLVIIASLSFINPAMAQEPVVHAVLFYSSTCGFCEKVITQDLPPLAEKYGQQLQLVGINISQEGGNAFYQAAVTHFNIPDSRLGVPTLIVNDTVLVGALEIPEQFPLIIEATLKAGGNDWPDVPGLKEALIAQGVIPTEIAPQTPEIATTDSSKQPQFIRTFLIDPIANSISVTVLLAMLAVVIVVTIYFLSDKKVKAFSSPRWVIPALILVGLFVSGYMSYVEITRQDAICGPVGDCNTVQESSYAKLFGVIPIGLLGFAGNLSILAAWLVQYYGPKNLRDFAARLVWFMAWFGILFSIYLTFLEPFVIGASCAWCLTSAIVMMLVFWFSTEAAKETWKSDIDESEGQLEPE